MLPSWCVARPDAYYGNLVALLTVMKALPLAYNKDMQEDKEPVIDSVASVLLCVRAMTGMIRDISINKERMQAMAGEGYSSATDIADWLVRELDMPFREAHHVTSHIVALAVEKKKKLEDLSISDMQSIEPKIKKRIYGVLNPLDSAKSRTSFGSTSPDNVKKSIAAAKKRFKL